MTEATRLAADRFLRETYGFDAATRKAILDRAVTDITRNYEALLQALTRGPGEASRRLAHRLKGNLRALGLTGLAARAQAVEAQAAGDTGDGLDAAVRALDLELDPDGEPS
jgi:HPt (histidine-containing phosphotransfer) domain-containing protein